MHEYKICIKRKSVDLLYYAIDNIYLLLKFLRKYVKYIRKSRFSIFQQQKIVIARKLLHRFEKFLTEKI